MPTSTSKELPNSVSARAKGAVKELRKLSDTKGWSASPWNGSGVPYLKGVPLALLEARADDNCVVNTSELYIIRRNGLEILEIEGSATMQGDHIVRMLVAIPNQELREKIRSATAVFMKDVEDERAELF